MKVLKEDIKPLYTSKLQRKNILNLEPTARHWWRNLKRKPRSSHRNNRNWIKQNSSRSIGDTASGRVCMRSTDKTDKAFTARQDIAVPLQIDWLGRTSFVSIRDFTSQWSKVELYLRRAHYFSSFWWLSTSGFLDSFVYCPSPARPRSIFLIVWVNCASFEITPASMNRRVAEWGARRSWLLLSIVRIELPWDAFIIHVINMAESSQAAMTEEGVYTDDTSTCNYFTVGDMVSATCWRQRSAYTVSCRWSKFYCRVTA